jgi:hypothetical protein
LKEISKLRSYFLYETNAACAVQRVVVAHFGAIGGRLFNSGNADFIKKKLNYLIAFAEIL